jgi:hypothetical protein
MMRDEMNDEVIPGSVIEEITIEPSIDKTLNSTNNNQHNGHG